MSRMVAGLQDPVAICSPSENVFTINLIVPELCEAKGPKARACEREAGGQMKVSRRARIELFCGVCVCAHWSYGRDGGREDPGRRVTRTLHTSRNKWFGHPMP